MRIWHEQLIPKLCQKHLCAMWRESLGAWKIIFENLTNLSYWKHPATQEFVNNNYELFKRLCKIRKEMLVRGYHPKDCPTVPVFKLTFGEVKQWQTLEEQIQIIKSKNCRCVI